MKVSSKIINHTPVWLVNTGLSGCGINFDILLEYFQENTITKKVLFCC